MASAWLINAALASTLYCSVIQRGGGIKSLPLARRLENTYFASYHTTCFVAASGPATITTCGAPWAHQKRQILSHQQAQKANHLTRRPK